MIYVCADDFGISHKACGRIIECIKNGAVNKVSVLPNTKEKDIPKDVILSIHLNFAEGIPVSKPDEIPLLVDERGFFKHSFVGLFILSVSSKKTELEQQLYTETKNQIRRCKLLGINPISLDSHQHTHMIPLIFNVVLKAAAEENIGYIRIPSEPIIPYILTPSLYFSYRPINLIKQWILKIFGKINSRKMHGTGIKSALFMGVLFSGKMDEKRVLKVLRHYIALAERKETDIEILFHPGYINPGEEVLDKEKTGFNKFYCSEGRKIEFDTLKNIILPD